jgi:hypothetical protein
MAGGARNTGMTTDERKSGDRMIKSGRIPGGRTVALGAVMIEVIVHMIRVSRRCKIAFMTSIASVTGSGVGCSMASLAVEGNVRSRQREAGRAMIPIRWIPGRGRVACLTLIGESGESMLGIFFGIVSLLMT